MCLPTVCSVCRALRWTRHWCGKPSSCLRYRVSHLIPGQCKWCSSSNTVSNDTVLGELNRGTQTAQTMKSTESHTRDSPTWLRSSRIMRSIWPFGMHIRCVNSALCYPCIREFHTDPQQLITAGHVHCLKSKIAGLSRGCEESQNTSFARNEDAWCELVLHFEFRSLSLFSVHSLALFGYWKKQWVSRTSSGRTVAT